MNSQERKVLLECIKQLEKSLRTDILTGCGNRYHFEDKVYKLWELEESFSIAFIDIDGLKVCNDHFGHLEGDRYIQSIGNYLNDICEDGEEIFRLGGDEFLFLSRKSSAEKLEERLESLRIRYRQDRKKIPYSCNFSYGCADAQEDGCQSVSDLLKLADERMYRMKSKHYKV